MDAQIWYAIFSTLVGGIYGACRRLGEVSLAPYLINMAMERSIIYLIFRINFTCLLVFMFLILGSSHNQVVLWK